MLIARLWAPGQQQQLFLLLDAQLHFKEMVIPGGPARESAQIRQRKKLQPARLQRLHAVAGGLTTEQVVEVEKLVPLLIELLDVLAAIRTAPDLYAAMTAANKKLTNVVKKHVPKYEYPTEVLTASMLEYLAKHGVSYAVGREDCVAISGLEDQARYGKAIFGRGYLLSEKAAAEKAAAEKAAAEKAAAEKAAAEKAAAEKDEVYVWRLSDQERATVRSLGM